MTQQKQNQTGVLEDLLNTVSEITDEMNPAYTRNEAGAFVPIEQTDPDANMPERRPFKPGRIVGSSLARLFHRQLYGYKNQQGREITGAEKFLTDFQSNAEEMLRRLGDRDPGPREVDVVNKAMAQERYVNTLRRCLDLSKDIFVTASVGEFNTWSPEIDQQLMDGRSKPQSENVTATDKKAVKDFMRRVNNRSNAA